MNGESRISLGTGVAAAAALGLLLAGAGATYVFMRTAAATTPETATPSSTSSAPSGVPGAGARDVVVTLTPDAVQRAGLTTATVALGTSATHVRLPGVVEPNAYRQVAVTPLVSGRITRVAAQLGARVHKGETMAEIYSPAIAEARTKYISAQTMLDAHDLELRRTEKLVEIGAASRQELERIHAEHAAQIAEVNSARAQLELLGVPTPAAHAAQGADTVTATSSVSAPIDGVITERSANVGLNVDGATRLFTVVDLSTVWIVADVYERDFSRVRIGSEAAITTPAYPGTTLRGRVSYIDPQVNAATRTAKVRIEVANARSDLRLGMFADVDISTGEATARAMIPRASIQQVGNRSVVYVVDPQPGRFVERAVTLGASSGQQVEVVSGLQPGDVVVAEGSFFLRAERERLGAMSGGGLTQPTPAPPGGTALGRDSTPQTANVLVTERGFEPATVTLRAGTPARITFLRTTDQTCGTEIVFPSLDITRALPLNTPVAIDFTPDRAKEIAFTCGMNMLKGVVAVE
jgi:membrane fusion protein, heavy metal efflux system